MEQDRLLRIEEVAAILGVSSAKVYAMVKRGEIPSVKLGVRSTRVRLRDVQQLVNGE